ncbi:MAG: hypothetical protein ONB27_01510 [candidate division KSB1 bacterium]|nr:hypothetical protein [candidate division KSB1 bacterium]
MIRRISWWIIILVSCLPRTTLAQDEVTAAMDEAKRFYAQKNIPESIQALNRALELLQDAMLQQLESLFPAPLDNWRSDPPTSRVNKTAYSTGLLATCKYFKKGGGPSIEIEIQTHAPRIANIKMAFTNPSLLNQMGGGAKISTIADQRCIERYDAVDKFAELIFVPLTSVLILVRGYEMNDTAVVAKFAERINWEQLAALFP